MLSELIIKASCKGYELHWNYKDSIFTGSCEAGGESWYSFSSPSMWEVGERINNYLEMCCDLDKFNQYLDEVLNINLN